MKGGKKYSLPESSEDLCQKPQRAIARFTAQNGLVDQVKPLIANQCGKKSAKKDKTAQVPPAVLYGPERLKRNSWASAAAPASAGSGGGA
jgi:hypothetical protein